MTPKEKAKDLLINYSFLEYDQNEGLKINNPTLKEAAKQSSIIAIEELIKEHTWESPISWNTQRKKYWLQVKEEINKL